MQKTGMLYSCAVQAIEPKFAAATDAESVNHALNELVSKNDTPSINKLVFSAYVNRLDDINSFTPIAPHVCKLFSEICFADEIKSVLLINICNKQHFCTF